MLIQRAFAKETLRAGGAVGVILVGIFLLVRVLGFLRQAADGDIPAGGVLLLLLLKTITYLDVLAPLALYIGALLVLERQRRANELTIFGACGMSLAALLKPALQVAALGGLLTALCALYVAPHSAAKARALTAELRSQAETGGLLAGRFVATRRGNAVYFVEGYDAEADALRNLFVYEGGAADRLTEDRLTLAAEGHRRVDADTGATWLVLENGVRYQAAAGRAAYEAMQFAEYGLRLTPRAAAPRRVSVSAMPTLDLWRAATPAALGELHWRFAKAAMPCVLLLFALALTNPMHRRRARAPTLAIALFVYFIYANLLGFGVAEITRGAAPAHGTLWLIHSAFLAVAAGLLWRRCRRAG